MKRERHGMASEPIYGIWAAMKTRCHNKNSPFYSHYGARGIYVCEKWMNSFSAFFEDMGHPPFGMSIERKDNNLGYSPENCVWASKQAQARNRRGRNELIVDGESKSMAEWSEITGVSISTIWARIKYGWSHEQAVNTKVGGAGFGPKPKAQEF